MLTNAAFLASDCDLNDQSYATTTNTYQDEKMLTRNVLGGKDDTGGRVYVWGLNDKEQLAGLKGSKVKVPTFSSVLSTLKPIHIAGGSKSLFIVSQEGKLYACGESPWGRLGLGVTHNNNISIPQELPIINEYIVKKVAVHSGGKHALAITLDGKIYSWGDGDFGKLGRGGSERCLVPNPIQRLNGLDIVQIE